MKFFKNIISFFSPKPPAGNYARLAGGRNYDAAQTNRHTENHFLNATNKDADSLIAADLATLRNRARYEVRNNCYAKGIVETKADDLIGYGPRLQLKTKNKILNRSIEDRFSQWQLNCDIAGRMCFTDILRLAASKQIDESGESITVFLDSGDKSIGPRLRLLVVEPDRLTTPMQIAGVSGVSFDGSIRYGIETDKFGRPQKYYILKKHPGADNVMISYTADDFDVIPASQVLHFFDFDRPGQTRGVPKIAPALPLFAQLRRYTLAVLAAAEQAANIAGVIYSDLATVTADDVESLESIEIERNSLLTMPKGWQVNQYKAEQPTTTYKEFKHEILNEIARVLNMPYNVAAANSAGYNYSSGRLDWQGYYKTIKTNQHKIELHYCNPIFFAWLTEARLIPGFLKGDRYGDILATDLIWHWPGFEHVDPSKEATAQKTRLESRTTTLSAEYARLGLDWKRQLEQIALEKETMEDLNLTTGVVKNEPEKKEDDQEDKKEGQPQDSNAVAANG